MQETWLRPHLDFILHGYVAVRRDRESGTGGGVAMFIQQGIGYRIINISKDSEAIVVEVWIGKTNIWIVNHYNPCGKLSKEALEKIIGEETHKTVWCGDFNAHSTLWGGTHTDNNGSVLEEFIEDQDLVCLNDGRVTRVDVARGLESPIDLTLVSKQIARISKWDVVHDTTVGSDQTGVGPIQLEKIGFPRWKLRNANWTLYNMTCSMRLERISQNRYDSIDDFNANEIMHSTAKKVIGKGSGLKQHKVVPWWSDECNKAIKARNKAFRKVKGSFSFNDLIEYKKTQAEVLQ